MDRTDLRIFSRLVGDPLLSDERIARGVGLTGKAVRLRRRRMEAARVLTEYGIHPPAEILGRYAVTWRYVGEEWTELPLAQLNEVEDLAYVRSFRPNFHTVVRYTKAPNPLPDPRLARILGRPVEATPELLPPVSSIPPGSLSRIDWRVLEAVVGAPRAPYSVLARHAKVSPRTFRIHQSKLERAHALQCAMILDLQREVGLATYGIWLKVDDTFDERSIELARLWDRPHWTQHPRGVYLLGSGDNYFEARELELRLRSLRGVVSADPLIPAGGFFARNRLMAWIRTERENRFPSPRRDGDGAPPRSKHRSGEPRECAPGDGTLTRNLLRGR
jgi:DNA-binding Lrp family transcriptional regulator